MDLNEFEQAVERSAFFHIGISATGAEKSAFISGAKAAAEIILECIGQQNEIENLSSKISSIEYDLDLAISNLEDAQRAVENLSELSFSLDDVAGTLSKFCKQPTVNS